MDEPNKDGSEVLETTEVDETTENDGLSTEQIAELKAKAARADDLEEKNKQLYERAKKAESKEPSKQDGLSNKDVIFLAKADIHDEDVEEVTGLARLKKISVSEAYDYLKPVLADRDEKRKTAQATQTTSSRGTTKTSPDELLNKASAGNLPEDDAGIQALVAAEMTRKQARK